MPVIAALVVGAVAGIAVGALALRFPAIDPAAPRVTAPTVRRDVSRHPRLGAFIGRRLDPQLETGLLMTAALVIAVGAAIGIGLLLVMVQHNVLLARLDSSAANWGAHHATTSATTFLRRVSLLGGTPGMIAVAVVVAIVESLRSRRATPVWFMAMVVVGASILMNLTKWAVDRSRPDVRRLTGFSGSSFPSGHATFAAATFAAAAFLLGRARPQRVKAICAGSAAAIAACVATSRVLLGVHWLTDVLAGLALGWGWFALTSVAFGGRVLRFGRPVEVAQVTAEQAARRAPPASSAA